MKPHLSPSALAMLSRCPMQFEFRYKQGIKRPPGVAAVIGKGTHKGVEQDLKNKIQTGDLLPGEQIDQIVAEATRDEFTYDRVLLSPDEKILGAKKVEGEAVDVAIQLARLHHAELAPVLAPTYVERPFRLELAGYAHDLLGYIDIQEGPGCIRDTKTRGRTPSQDEVDRSVQLTVYALAVKALDGAEEPPVVRLDCLIKTKKPKLVVLEASRTVEDFQRLLLRVERAEKVIEAGTYYPTMDANVCSEKWCGYYDLCDFGARKATMIAMPAAVEPPVVIDAD